MADSSGSGGKEREKVPDRQGEDLPERILAAELELGRLLFLAGASGQRIRDSITYLNEKLHGGTIDISPGFESLILSHEQNGKRRSAMCEYSLPAGLDSRTLITISSRLRALPDPASPEEVLRDLKTLEHPRSRKTLAAFLAAAGFSIVFGYFNNADALALLIIGIAAFLSALTLEAATRARFNYYVCILAATFVATFSSLLLSQWIPTGTPVVSLLIPCVFMVPGFHLMNGGWEVFRNHMHLGIPTLMVFLNVIAILSLGTLLVLLACPLGPDSAGIILPPDLALVVDTVLGIAVTFFFCVLVGTPRQALPVCLLCGALGRLVRTLVVFEGGDIALAVFCGTLVISVIAFVLCRDGRIPVVLPLMAASVQFVPGYYFLSCLHGMTLIMNHGASVSFSVVAVTLSMGLEAVFISFAIIFGTLLPLLALSRDTRWY